MMINSILCYGSVELSFSSLGLLFRTRGYFANSIESQVLSCVSLASAQVSGFTEIVELIVRHGYHHRVRCLYWSHSVVWNFPMSLCLSFIVLHLHHQTYLFEVQFVPISQVNIWDKLVWFFLAWSLISREKFWCIV